MTSPSGRNKASGRWVKTRRTPYYWRAFFVSADPEHYGDRSSGATDEPVQINFPPVATGADLDCVNVGAATTGNATANDPDSGPGPLSYVLVTPPSGGTPTFSFNTATGAFSYTPDATRAAGRPTGSHPMDSFSFKAFDGANYSNVATVNLSINRAPVAVADTIATQLNVTTSGNLLNNDSDPDGTRAAEQVMVCKVNGSTFTGSTTVSNTLGTLTVASTGAYTFVPAANKSGSFTFTYTICDHCGLASTVTDTIQVSSNARTQGYWKNHQSAFDAVLAAHPNVAGYTSNGKLLLGLAAYTSTEAIALMNMSTGTGTSSNALLMVWQQLVAAKLNVLNGVVGNTTDLNAITDADAAIDLAAQQILGVNYNSTSRKMTGNKKGVLVYSDTAATGAFIATASTPGQRMVNDNNILDAFNNSGTGG